MLKVFKGPEKIKGDLKKILLSRVTCPNQGLLKDIFSRHL
jgi:hypothetical protein